MSRYLGKMSKQSVKAEKNGKIARFEGGVPKGWTVIESKKEF